MQVKPELISAVAIVIIAAAFISTLFYKSDKSPQSSAVSNSAKITNKPRLIELYTNWTGCQQGHARCVVYNNIVGQCASVYSGKVDFQILNMDSEHDRKLGYQFAVGTSALALPTIYIFNSSGSRVASFNDDLSYAQLDACLRDPQLYK